MNILTTVEHLTAVAVQYRTHLHTCGICRGEQEGICGDAPYYLGELRAAMRLVEDTTRPDAVSAERCQYCGARPSWPVLWHTDGRDTIVHLCESCDKREMLDLEGESCQ
jgi:hypothetical protein